MLGYITNNKSISTFKEENAAVKKAMQMFRFGNDGVFSVFKKATKVIGESFALKNIMEQIQQQ